MPKSFHPAKIQLQHLKSKILWRLNRPLFDEKIIALYKTLKQNGFLKLSLEDVGLNRNDLIFLQKRHQELLLNSITNNHCNNSNNNKRYWKQLLGNKNIPLSEKYFNIVLNNTLLTIVNHHLNCYSQLLEYNYWHNIKLDSAEPVASQLWHRDTLFDKKGFFINKVRAIIKAFIFLSEVDIKKGAFYYVRGSHNINTRNQITPCAIEPNGAIRYSDASIIQYFGKNAIEIMIGSPGTIIIFDASGLHKGGHIIEKESRSLFKMEFGSWLWNNFPYPKLYLDKSNRDLFLDKCSFQQLEAIKSLL